MLALDIETTGLYPSPSKEAVERGEQADYIVAIGCLSDFEMNILTVPFDSYKVSLENSERLILTSFCDYLLHLDDNTLLTYNGIFFDNPFITTKLLKYGGDTFANTAKLLSEMKHIDLMGYSIHVCGKRLAKDDACRKLANLYVPHKSEGLWNARIYKNPQLLTENDHMEMLQHNATDLTATARLYNVVKKFPDYSAWRLKEAV